MSSSCPNSANAIASKPVKVDGHFNFDFVSDKKFNGSWADVEDSPPQQKRNLVWSDVVKNQSHESNESQPEKLDHTTIVSPLLLEQLTIDSPKSVHASDDKEWRNNTQHTNTYNNSFSKKWNRSKSSYRQDSTTVKCDIEVCDESDLYTMHHYMNCTDDTNDVVKSARGIVKADGKIICKTFGYTPEITVDKNTDISKISDVIESFDQCKFYDAEEGCLIRLFFHNNKWNICTHRKLDAMKSKWGMVHANSKSFGELFLDAIVWQMTNNEKIKFENVTECWDRFSANLDTNLNYTFLLRNVIENRIVCDIPEHPTVFFSGAFHKSTHLLVEGNNTHIPTSKQHDFKDVKEMIEYVKNIDYKKTAGIYVFMPNQKQVKLINSEYQKRFDARGNEPSIVFRYLQLRKTEQVDVLKELYPEYIPKFEMYEDVLNEITNSLYKLYVRRFIHHHIEFTPQLHHFILKEAHSWHKSDTVRNRISFGKMNEIVNSKEATYLNRLIKDHLKNLQKQEYEQEKEKENLKK